MDKSRFHARGLTDWFFGLPRTIDNYRLKNDGYNHLRESAQILKALRPLSQNVNKHSYRKYLK